MNKGLECLKTIKHTTDLYRPNELNGYENEIDIIETELKRLEELVDTKQRSLDDVKAHYDLLEYYFFNLQKEKEKQDEILRIIKEKNVNVCGIINAPTLEYYDDHCRPRHSEPLTQVEFDLLKEFFK